MAAKNDITGDSIQSKVLSAQGRANWDNIFGKKNAYEWQLELYGEDDLILDPDGWRGHDRVTLETPISRADFHTRFSHCTIRFLPTLK
jgi:hypothetical protein